MLPQAENLFKAVLLLALLFASFWLATHLAASFDDGGGVAGLLKWLMIGLFAVLNVILLTGMGILAHEAVHRVLFRSAFWNELWGGLLSAFALIPFNANRQFHLTHHSYAHQPGLDPENAQHHHAFLYAATIGSALALNAQYILLLENLRRLGERRHVVRLVKDLACLGFVFSIYLGVLPALGMPVWYTLVPIVVVFPLVFAFRAMSDHYGVPAVVSGSSTRCDVYDVEEGSAVGEGRTVSGWVVLTAPWLEWLWSHVNYHEVHHKYPWLSHRYLPGVFAATRSDHPYLVVRGYWRSLLNLRRLNYYTTHDDVRAFRSDTAS
ncbi:fatty acid desaturase [Uliginosibacterium sp. H3]|uniref:Fatty acid desaturase n=1 Tax=Uliginosibacterium silvisoli TaxID=3114758 RepID=A0ABU6K7I1_9RHOO|nr:fatty acid desaturase [Uliginosibacterium sp. H3]